METNREYLDPLARKREILFEKDPEDNPFESAMSLQRIYKELYEEFVDGLKMEKFKPSIAESED
ncbi:MAG TPA: hypothetical protein VKK79_26075 [Candidatus Lokiarchaeia archaeon]|nr:hypothetical protein [Candidatus Lokiarchaeia archaeon]